MLETVGHFHGPAVIPDGRVVPLGGVVVQDEEIAHAVVFHFDPAVVRIDDARIKTRICSLRFAGQVIDQRRDGDLDEIDAGGFERLEKPARESNGHTVAVPGLAAPTRRESQGTRVRQWFAVEPRQEL